MWKPGDDDSVFVNCPFDKEYKPIFDALIFTIFDCGFVPRCAKEEDDASRVTVDVIYDLIKSCRYAIHDLSRTEADRKSQLPRFNMPLELGIFLGAKKFGEERHKGKQCLILCKRSYQYQKFISDIAGQKVIPHNNVPKKAIKIVRDWLAGKLENALPSDGAIIWNHYREFTEDLPAMCQKLELNLKDLPYKDYIYLAVTWLKSRLVIKGEKP